MSKEFSGVWATFEYLDDMCDSISELRKSGYEKLTTHSPCPRHEIDHALGDPQSRVPFFTLAGAFCGTTLAVAIISFMTLDWILPVSGKPVLSFPVMVPIIFELSVLLSIYFTVFSMIAFILRDMKKHPKPQSDKYKQYRGFSRDRFGVVVPCSQHDFEKVEAVFNNWQAEEVNREA